MALSRDRGVAPKACKIAGASAILLALSRCAFCEPISHAVGRDRCAFCSRKRTVRTFLAGLCLALLVQVAAYAGSDSVEDFYRGKVITLFVGYGPGGGFDLIARLLARHLGKPHSRQSDHRRAEHAGRRHRWLRRIIFTTSRRATARNSASSPATCRCSACSATIRTCASIRASSPGSARHRIFPTTPTC